LPLFEVKKKRRTRTPEAEASSVVVIPFEAGMK
jgi:hypothetical protein